MSGSSLDGLDIAFVEFHENGGNWTYEMIQTECYPYSDEWVQRLKNAINLPAADYQVLHAEYGHFLGRQVNTFIHQHHLQYQVSLVASHGHTTFHMPERGMTAQLGDGAAIAAETKLPVVTDLRALDVALGGQGAPIVPIGEKLLWSDFGAFLNLGGIANISFYKEGVEGPVAYDICPANRVLNMLAQAAGKPFDEDGLLSASGTIHEAVLDRLNALDYYARNGPKSLANDFGTDTVYPILVQAGLPVPDALRTYIAHIVYQTGQAVRHFPFPLRHPRMLVTGGGAFNAFLVKELRSHLGSLGIELLIPGQELVAYKEALIMALIGVLRWRQEYNVLATVTGASRHSIGGALWTGEEA